ncbi:unnamed protein product [Bursaphelenchus okinawaensis]|uniref:Neuropeptide-Like Protein n=1 Tax=Bursaphelenchus okinawaensis TaxID=465554 RepID=A0A811LPW9_9BILA|nr:unnamed protein product [Bursaphelenchus okinawaensis]CAG9125851.1 unnamed protein product [Bursaphelenchus okinawaensis]
MGMSRISVYCLVLSLNVLLLTALPTNARTPLISSFNFQPANGLFSGYRRSSEFLQKRDIDDIYQMDPYELGIKFGRRK